MVIPRPTEQIIRLIRRRLHASTISVGQYVSDQWEPPQITTEIRETARLLLLANGAKEPRCGWDEYGAEPGCPVEDMVIWPENG